MKVLIVEFFIMAPETIVKSYESLASRTPVRKITVDKKFLSAFLAL